MSDHFIFAMCFSSISSILSSLPSISQRSAYGHAKCIQKHCHLINVCVNSYQFCFGLSNFFGDFHIPQEVGHWLQLVVFQSSSIGSIQVFFLVRVFTDQNAHIFLEWISRKKCEKFRLLFFYQWSDFFQHTIAFIFPSSHFHVMYLSFQKSNFSEISLSLTSDHFFSPTSSLSSLILSESANFLHFSNYFTLKMSEMSGRLSIYNVKMCN